MNKADEPRDLIASLRKRAEDRMNQRQSQLPNLSEAEIAEVVYDLGTHKVELEIQNEELRCAQLQIVQSRDRYADLYDFAPIGFVTLNQRGKISEANLTAIKLFQLDFDEIVGKNFATLVHEEDSDSFFVQFRKISQTDAPGSIELRLVRDSGSFFHARLDIGIARSNSVGTSSRLVSICDISQKKEADEERQQIQAQLQHAHRLESLGVLAGDIAHDFNNLLTCIELHNSLIADNFEPDSVLHGYAGQVTIAVQQAAELCNQMLCYAGKNEVKQQSIDLSAALRNTTALLRSTTKNNYGLEISLSDKLPRIIGDLSEIQQVVMNLVINACEASQRGDIVTIATFAINAQDPLLEKTTMSAPLEPGDYVCIEVVDTGDGISQENLAKIYEPFYSTKFVGRGLGLSVVAGIIRRHKGAISIDSVQGCGTTFRVLLPVVACKESLAPQTMMNDLDVGQTSRPDFSNIKSILVVDDEAAVLNALQAILEANHFDTLSAQSGKEAVELFARRSNDISLILLDLVMPGFTIDETLEGIRAIQNDVPIIIMSGYSEEDASKLLTDWDIAEFLQKPCENIANNIKQIFHRIC